MTVHPRALSSACLQEACKSLLDNPPTGLARALENDEARDITWTLALEQESRSRTPLPGKAAAHRRACASNTRSTERASEDPQTDSTRVAHLSTSDVAANRPASAGRYLPRLGVK